MRIIGHLRDETSARTFGDYLTSLEIPNTPESESDGQWSIWVHAEEQVEAGQAALAQFLQNRRDAKFQAARGKAAAIREREEKAKSDYHRRFITSEALWPSYPMGPLTIVLIGICVGVAFKFGFNPSVPQLYLSTISRKLPEVQSGEVWRLVTPIFMHGFPLHLIFNMLWLKDLGSMVESREGSFKLLLLVLVVAIGSNLGQDLVAGPIFLGMSGVVYGLFGYIWMRGKFDPASGLRLLPSTVVMMIGWFFICVFGIISNVANGCHGFGLVIGMVWALFRH